MEIPRIRYSASRRLAKTAAFVFGAVCIAACGATHNSSSETTNSVNAAGSNHSPIVLTLADSGHKVTLSPGANLTVDLAKQAGSADQWTLLTAGPGVTETNGGTYGQSHSAPPSQLFDFRWNRTTPFGLVMILESPKKKVLEPQEFAVTLEPKGYKSTTR
jgi:hypothetical protein